MQTESYVIRRNVSEALFHKLAKKQALLDRLDMELTERMVSVKMLGPVYPDSPVMQYTMP